MTIASFNVLGKPRGCCLLVGMRGDLDMATVPVFVEEVEHSSNAFTRHIVVDAAELTFVDSSGLGAFVGVGKAMKDGLALARATETVRRTVEISGFGELLPLLSSVPAARKYLHDRPNQSPIGSAES